MPAFLLCLNRKNQYAKKAAPEILPGRLFLCIHFTIPSKIPGLRLFAGSLHFRRNIFAHCLIWGKKTIAGG